MKTEEDSYITGIKPSLEPSYESEDGDFSISFEIMDPPIYKFRMEGFARVENVRKTQAWISDLLDQLSEQGHKKTYFIADVQNFRGTSWRGKMEFQNLGKILFEENRIRHLSLIKPSLLVENMIYLVKKIQPGLKITIHESEKEGIKKLRDIRKSKKRKSKNVKATDDILNANVYHINGEELLIISKPDWKLEFSGNHRVEFYLLNGEVVLYREIGSLTNVEDIESVSNTLAAVIKYSGLDKLIFITDFSKLNFVSLKCRKSLATQLHKYKTHWKFKYYIFPKLIRAMYNVYIKFDPSIVKNSLLVKGWQEAVKKYVEKETYLKDQINSVVPITHVKSVDYGAYTKDQLVSIIQKKEESINELNRTQQLRIDSLFDIISKISWNENFKPSSIKYERADDPFTPLTNAIHLLENDVYEIVNDLKDFNTRLEKKVNLRTGELEMQNEELLKVNAELDSFVYKTSHDLRAPLVTIMGLVNLYKNEKDQKEKDKYLELVGTSVKKLDGFIRDIIEFSRNARLEY